MDLGLTGHRAIVTGASRGIGLAVARGLVAEGAAVALVARTADDLDAAAVGMRAAAPDAVVLSVQAAGAGAGSSTSPGSTPAAPAPSLARSATSPWPR